MSCGGGRGGVCPPHSSVLVNRWKPKRSRHGCGKEARLVSLLVWGVGGGVHVEVIHRGPPVS